MCVSLPARVLSVTGRIAEVEVNQLRRNVLLTTDVAVGDWVLTYGGAALTVIDQESAQEILRLIEAAQP